jgi:anaerobic selenocysteine-containing dehydrogenase
MIIVGNTHETVPNIFNSFKFASQAGVKIISVDPRATATTNLATHWLQIRPGTDIALWFSWLRLIILNEWFDKEFVYDWTNAPFLVRTDTRKILRAEELVDNVPRDAFVVWNAKTQAPSIWDAEERKYLQEGVEKALTGSYSIKLKNGETVECKTAWTLLTERAEEWTPEKASEVTGIPAAKIVDACETYAQNQPSLFLVPGHCYDAFAPGSSSVFRLQNIIKAIMGNMDRTELLTGCYDNTKLVSIYEMELKPDEAFTEEEKKHQPGWDRFRALSFLGYDLKAKYEKKHWGLASNAMYSNQGHHHVMWQDIIDEKPGRTRAMIINGSNPMIKYGNTKRVYEAMKKLDLIVTLEFTMTPSAVMSDYVLPMSDWFERPEIGPSTPCDIFNFIHVSDAVMPPEFERRSDYDVFKGLAERLGFGKDWPWKDLTECYNWRAQGLLQEYGCKDIAEFAEKVGFDYPPPIIEQYKLRNGFATPTAMAEVWSVMLEELGYDPIPYFVEPAMSPRNVPELYEQYPFTLIGIDRHLPNYHSQFYEVPSLRKMMPEPLVDIHFDTARLANPPINNGDWVWIETRKGRIKQRARLTFGIDENCVKTTHHFWYPEMPGEEPYLHGVWISNTNVLTEDDPEMCDPVFGSWPHTAIPCKIYKAVDGANLESDRSR